MTTLPQNRDAVLLHFKSLVQERIGAVTIVMASPDFDPLDVIAGELEFLTGLIDLIKRSF